MVHITEAHGEHPGQGGPERARRVRQALQAHGMTIPAVLDTEGTREAERAYDAFPKRLVVVGADGRVALDAGHGLEGPRGWDLAAVESWLKAQCPGSVRAVRRDHPPPPSSAPRCPGGPGLCGR
jgi:hypothetical protein